MRKFVTALALVVAASFAVALDAADSAPENAPAGWTTAAPRDEIKPLFQYQPNGGRAGREAWIIAGDNRDGTSGWWQKTFPVEGGQTYAFSAWRKLDSVESARRSGLVRVLWRDEQGRSVKRDEPTAGKYQQGSLATAEPEYPLDKETDAAGWTEVGDVYTAPQAARQAVVELHYRWGAWRQDCLERRLAEANDLSAANREAGGNSLSARFGQDAGGKA